MLSCAAIAQPAFGQTGTQPFPGFFNILDFGAAPGDDTSNTAAFTKAGQACAAAGGGTIYVPPGIFLTGPISFGSNTIVHLAPGAIVKGSPALENYLAESQRMSGESARAGLLTFRNAENVALTGLGCLDGNSLAFHQQDKIKGGHDWDPRFTRQGADYMDPKFGVETGPLNHGERPGNVVRFINCKRVRLAELTVRNSPTWTMLFHGCEDVTIEGLNINSLGSGRRVPNDDGMDLRDCRNVRIANCNIQTGDDCIAIFGSQDVTVTNCNLSARSAGIRVGYAGGDSRRCVFQNLTIEANCGLKVNARGGGSVEDILFSNITMRTGLITGHWWGKGEPFNVSAVPMRVGVPAGVIRRIRFNNIVAESENSALIYGSPESVIEDVQIENFRLAMRDSKLQSSYGGNFDLRGAADLSQALFEHDIPGLFFRHVRGLRVRNFQLKWDSQPPAFFSHGIQGEEFQDIRIEGYEGAPAPGRVDAAAISLKNGSGVSIVNSTANSAVEIFLSHSNVIQQGLFIGNDLTQVSHPFRPARHAFTLSGNRMPR